MTGRPTPSRPPVAWLWAWAPILLLLVAAALRLVACGQVPPGLYHDEAFNGLDALGLLQGRLALYFPANNGREPLFIYLVAATLAMVGRSPLAVRLAAFPVGVLTIAATAAAGRALFSRRVGLLAAAVLAVTLWHVHLSRVGFRAVMLPLFIALTVWQAALAWRKKERGRWHWVATGVFYGLSFYTYTAARFTPVALLAFAVYLLVMSRKERSYLPHWHSLLLALLAVLLTLVPLGVYTLIHPDVVLGRPGQVWVFNPQISGGDPWGLLGRQVLRALEMFFVRGDRIWRHNVPWRPVFDPLLGAAFVLGLVIALRRARQEPAAGLLIIWTGVMLLPTILAEDTPHFLRAVGVLPMAALLPALGLDALIGQRAEQKSLWPGRAAAAVVLLYGLGSTAWAYFGEYARAPLAGYWFERGATALAGRVNGFLGTGWDGARMVREPQSAARQVYLDPVLWEGWPQVRFLVPPSPAITIGLPPTSNFQPPTSTLQTAFFLWPYDDWQRVWALLPAPAEITVEEGALSQGDRDPAPYTTYLAFFASPPDPTEPALARFSGGVELLGATVTSLDTDRLRVRLRWRATAPLDQEYTVFLHYLRDGERIAQGDSLPAGGRFPTSRWRPGDVVNDDHIITGVGAPQPGRDALRFGLWNPASGATLYLLDAAGNPAGDWIVVDVEEVAP